MPLNSQNNKPWYESWKWRRIMAKLPKRVSSAGLQLETQDGQLLIVKAHYKQHWSLPSGVIEPGETPKQAAVRETFEEVGLSIDPTTVEFVRVTSRHSKTADTYQFIFRAPLSHEAIDQIVLQQSEIAEYALVTRADVAVDERHYGEVIKHWAAERTGYVEQVFGS